MSKRLSHRLLLLSLSGAGFALLALLQPATPARADKVGVAAAVHPDAFSVLNGGERSQVNLGKSIFFNERINTTDKGLVQVLLVDGSTFTVGPGSDLVIDKFVYDPNKGKGEVVASFSKGVMRFVGGKISKNDGGVTVNTPEGALSIRGGMFQGKIDKGGTVFSFLFGEYLSLGGKKIFTPGYSFYFDKGGSTIQPTKPEDTAFIMGKLVGGGHVYVWNNNNQKPNSGNPLQHHVNTAEITQEGAQNIIQSQLQTEEDHEQAQSTKGVQGYSGGVVTGQSDSEQQPAMVTSNDPNDVNVKFKGQKFSSAEITVGDQPSDTDHPSNVEVTHVADTEGNQGLKVVFTPQPDPASYAGKASVGNGSDVGSITLNGQSVLHGEAQLVGSSTALCSKCDFMKWGAWGANIQPGGQGTKVADNQADNENGGFHLLGWWVAGNVVSSSDLPKMGGATYSGTAIGTVANNLHGDGWQTYVASGDMSMNWNFASRSGNLNIDHFDTSVAHGNGLSFSGAMSAPGTLNRFGGNLALTNQCLPRNLADLAGTAQGSFVRGGNNPAAGVLGNWKIGGSRYGAAGIFGGSAAHPN